MRLQQNLGQTGTEAQRLTLVELRGTAQDMSWRSAAQGILGEEKLHTEAGAAPFNWLKQWYALAVADDLDPSRPHGQQLMGALAHPVPQRQPCSRYIHRRALRSERDRATCAFAEGCTLSFTRTEALVSVHQRDRD